MAAYVKTNPNIVHLDVERVKRRGDRPMKAAELLDEFEFLLDTGAHPMLAAQLLGVKYGTLNRIANRYDRSELFTRFDTGAWNRYRHDTSNQYGQAA